MIKNIIAIFSIVLLLGLAYYLFIADNSTNLDFVTDQTISAQLLQNSQVFIERQRLLQTINIDTSIFSDTRFGSLRSFELPVPVVTVGRGQLFDTAVPTAAATISDPDQ